MVEQHYVVLINLLIMFLAKDWTLLNWDSGFESTIEAETIRHHAYFQHTDLTPKGWALHSVCTASYFFLTLQMMIGVLEPHFWRTYAVPLMRLKRKETVSS
jgi:hypothetical protein